MKEFPVNRDLALTRFFESSPMMMGIIEIENDDIRHISDNPAAAKFFGHAPDEMYGKFSSELGVPRPMIDQWLSHYRSSEKTGNPKQFEYDHGDKILSVSVTYMGRGATGNPQHSYIVEDVTDCRRAERELRRKVETQDEIISSRTEEAELERLKLKCLIDTAPIGIAFLDRKLNYQIVNPILAGLNGKSPKEHAHRSVYEVIPEHAPEVAPMLQKVIDTDTAVRNWEYTTPQGQTYIANYFPVILNGESAGIGATVIDITHKKQIEEDLMRERAFLNEVLDQIPAAVWIVEAPEGKVILQNGIARTFMQQPDKPATKVDEYNGYTSYHTSGKPYEAHEYPSARALLKGEVILDEEMVIVRADGSRGYARASAGPVKNLNGEIIAAVCIATDISAKKQSEDALWKSFQLIEHKKIELEEEKTFREKFIASLTHDLRTPLSAARMSAQVLAKKVTEEPAAFKSAHRIVENMDRANKMIQDILDVSFLKSGQQLPLNPEPLKLFHLLTEVIEDLSAVHGAEKFRLSGDHEIEGNWDRDALKRVFENLLSNGVKYGFTYTPVSINISSKENTAVVEVHNDGNPIPATDLEKVFQPYHRAESAQVGTQKGWGIGLALVKGIIDSHNGKVSVESRASLGTSFFVSLPR